MRKNGHKPWYYEITLNEKDKDHSVVKAKPNCSGRDVHKVMRIYTK